MMMMMMIVGKPCSFETLSLNWHMPSVGEASTTDHNGLCLAPWSQGGDILCLLPSMVLAAPEEARTVRHCSSDGPHHGVQWRWNQRTSVRCILGGSQLYEAARCAVHAHGHGARERLHGVRQLHHLHTNSCSSSLVQYASGRPWVAAGDCSSDCNASFSTCRGHTMCCCTGRRCPGVNLDI